ncbi:unnamed protein product [Caenorhabditis bovis]|uniref:General transcription factor IIH subunit 4 n=1 Tax=Caenorhabditis bovis TaxID=2654633 RepID=A0A8S1F0Q3_9PELO|nr:unnamed protein product [Caenorhabditis bovis]
MSSEASSSNQECLFLQFIKTLSSEDRSELIAKPSCAYFMFRMLPPIAQQVIVQLIWNGNVAASKDMIEKIDMSASTSLLKDLNIVDENGEIDVSFRRAYVFSMLTGSTRVANLRTQMIEEKKKQKDVSKKALERWDCILRYLALPSEQNINSVSVTTRALFQSAGFTSGDGQRDIEITTTGFQFLLLSPVQQMWTYVIEYLKLEMKSYNSIVELIELLIQVILCAHKGFEPGHEAFVLDNNWSERQSELINHLRELGVIFIRKRKDGIFFLTPLIQHLATNETSMNNPTDKSSSGSIIVETNFRLYAYTSSPLQLAILSTFTEMTYRFNDMSVGMLTRESVRRALQVGITAAQIISFLRTNAHPQCLANGGPLNCLPITVADQIRLWEDERKRMVLNDAYMYSTFESEQEFFGVRDFAAAEGILLWADTQQKLVIVTESGHEKVKQWYKANRRGSDK